MSELWGTTHTQPGEPLTPESLMKGIEATCNEYRELPVEIISPQEYFGRLGYRNTISADKLAMFFQEHTP